MTHAELSRFNVESIPLDFFWLPSSQNVEHNTHWCAIHVCPFIGFSPGVRSRTELTEDTERPDPADALELRALRGLRARHGLGRPHSGPSRTLLPLRRPRSGNRSSLRPCAPASGVLQSSGALGNPGGWASAFSKCGGVKLNGFAKAAQKRRTEGAARGPSCVPQRPRGRCPRLPKGPPLHIGAPVIRHFPPTASATRAPRKS